MAKRQLIMNDYKTAEDGLWTLSSLKVTKASQVQTFVSVPGRFSPLDLSTALTDGQPYYGNASLEAVLESSEGTRDERKERIAQMVNLLDGYLVHIIHPDYPGRYMVGRVQLQQSFNDPVHCAVRVSAICEPWSYNSEETVAEITVPTTEEAFSLTNSGRMAMVPTVKVTNTVNLEYGAHTWALSAGEYQLPELYLTPGEHEIRCSGSGKITFTYREAVLAE